MNSYASTAVVCVANEGNEESLQLWKIYKTLRDDDAQGEGLIRVIDESGEDYLFPQENFVPIALPMKAKRPFERAIREQRRSAPGASVSSSRGSIRAKAARRRRTSRG